MRLYLSRPEQYAIAVLLLAIVGALVVLSYAYATRRATGPPPPFLQKAEPAATGDRTLAVHVSGAVRTPGLYHLKLDARIADALEAAGGAMTEAAPDALNLAAPVEDGSKITVPTKDEWLRMRKNEVQPPLVESGKRGAAPTAGATPPPRSTPVAPAGARKVSLNTATLADLDTLPGVGPVTAQRILDYRATRGKFTDVAQLLDVKGIGPKTYEKIAPYVTL